MFVSNDDSLLASDLILRSGKGNIQMDLTPIRKENQLN